MRELDSLNSESGMYSPSGARFSKVLIVFRARKAFYVYRLCSQDQSFNNFENDTMKVLVNEALLTGL